MYYTEKEIIEKCETASVNMNFFYKADVINYRGKTKEKKYYTEIVAEWLLDNLDKLNLINTIERQKPYKTRHAGELGNKTNRVEEYIAKQLYNFSKKQKDDFPGLGKIIDYQTPLKANNDSLNKGLGKIDLLSINKKDKSVYILELKKNDSKETMLRCVLESYTYLSIISKAKLLRDFNIPKDYKVKASPLVFRNSSQYNEFMDSKREYLHQLMTKLDSVPFFIEETPDKYKIFND